MPYPPPQQPVSPKSVATIVALVIGLIVLWSCFYIVEPGHRGILVTLGKVHTEFAPEGMGFKMPIITTVRHVPIRQQTKSMPAECYSSDLQQVNMELKVLYRIPEKSVVEIFKDYSGDPFQSLIVPRVAEAVKEVTALQSAEQIVKKREEVKIKALDAAKRKIGDLLDIQDLVIENVNLSKELESAIEAKMVQEQEASKARFIQQKSEIEAATAIIRAKGEAESIRIRGQALQSNPGLIQLQLVEKWNGVAPLVVAPGSGAGAGGASIILPVGNLNR
jgi:prohibitin 2